MPLTCVIPGDKEIGAAVNRGVPITLSAPRSAAAKAMRELAELLLPPVAGAESKGVHAAAKSDNGNNKEQSQRPAKQASAGRQSVLKAGMSRFSKSRDKKAA